MMDEDINIEPLRFPRLKVALARTKMPVSKNLMACSYYKKNPKNKASNSYFDKAFFMNKVDMDKSYLGNPKFQNLDLI